MVSIKHPKVSSSPAGKDANRIYGPDWNAQHVITGTPQTLLGFDANGDVQEVAQAGSTVGLNNVTNDAQTKAAVVPNTAPAAGRVLVGNAGGTAYAPVAVSGDGTMGATGALTVTKLNGVSPGAFFSGTDAANLTGTIANARLSLTAADVGLGNVTNDIQTKAAIVPNTAPAAGQVLIGNAGGTAYAQNSISGDAALSAAGVLTVSKTGGVAFGGAATKNVGSASGTVAAGDDSRFSITQSGTGAVAKNLNALLDSVFMPEMFGAAADTVSTKAAITTVAGNTTVTIAGANFTNADIGKIIALDGCGYYVAKLGTLAAGGSGYGTLPTLTLVGGTAVTPTTLYATGPGSAALTAFNQYRNIGKYSVVPASPVATTSDDSGTGATITVTWRNLPHRATITAVNSSTNITLSAAPIVSLTASVQAVIYGTDDTAAVDKAVGAAVAAARSGKPAAVGFTRGYTITSQIEAVLSSSDAPFSLLGLNGIALIHEAITADNIQGLVITGPGDQVGKSAIIATDRPRGVKTITLSNSTAVAKGDFFWLTARNFLGYDMGQVNRADDVAGTVVTLAHPLYFPVTAAFPTSVQMWGAARNVTVSDLIIDGLGSTGTGTVGFLCLAHSGLTVRNVHVRNFSTAGSEGAALYEALRSQWDVRVTNCGGDNGTFSAHASYVGESRVCIDSETSYGFGVQTIYASGNTFDLRSHGSLGRGIKLQGSCANKGSLDQSNSGPSIWTGIAFEISSYNDFYSVTSFGNSIGLWSQGTGNTGNVIRSFRYGNNSTDITIGTNDAGWIIGCGGETINPVVTDSGTATQIDGAPWTAFTFTPVPGSGAFTTATGSGRYKRNYKTITAHLEATITTNGTGGSSVNMILPVTPASGALVSGVGATVAITGKMLKGTATAGSTTLICSWYDGTYPGANGEILEMTVTYESA